MAKKTTETGKEDSAKKAAPKTKLDEKKVTAEKPVKKSASSTKVAEKSVTKAVAAAKEKKPSTKKPMPGEPVKRNVESYSRFSDFDVSLFKSGKHYKLYEKMGAHVVEYNGIIGTYFAVWAPNAQYVSVIGNFNGWNRGSHALNSRWTHQVFGKVILQMLAMAKPINISSNQTPAKNLKKAIPLL